MVAVGHKLHGPEISNFQPIFLTQNGPKRKFYSQIFDKNGLLIYKSGENCGENFEKLLELIFDHNF